MGAATVNETSHQSLAHFGTGDAACLTA